MFPSDYELHLKEEIWGVFKHIGIPFETIYSMPVHDRRFYIMKHNEEQEGIKRQYNKNENVWSYSGDLNAFAKNEQNNQKIQGGRI